MQFQFIVHNWYLFVALAVVLTMLVGGPLRQMMLGIRHVSIAEAIRLLNHEQAVIVDVREAEEYRSGHIPKAVHAPLSGLSSGLAQLEKFKSRPIIVSCRTSNRSARAAMLLRQKQFANVQVLAGGIQAWQGENLPVEK